MQFTMSNLATALLKIVLEDAHGFVMLEEQLDKGPPKTQKEKRKTEVTKNLPIIGRLEDFL